VVVDDIAVLRGSLGVVVAGAAAFESVGAGEGVLGVVPLPVQDVPAVPVAVGVGVRVPVLPVAVDPVAVDPVVVDPVVVDPVAVEPAAVEVVIAPPVVSGVVAGVAGFCATGAGVGYVGVDVVGGVVVVVGGVVVVVGVGVVVVGVVVAGFAVVPVVLVCCATAGGAAISRGRAEVDGLVAASTGSRTKVTPATSVFLSG